MSRLLRAYLVGLLVLVIIWVIFTQHHDARFEITEDEDLNQSKSDVLRRLLPGAAASESTSYSTLPSQLQELLNERDTAILRKLDALQRENDRLHGHLTRHITDTLQWKPLRDMSKYSVRSFISEVSSRRDHDKGPPEIFEFPAPNGKHLCFKGNDSRNGTRNFYTFAWPETLPAGAILLNGTTLIVETDYDFVNPWHSHYNLVQFVWWKARHQCERADRLLLFHWSELRNVTRVGNWITQVLTATGLPKEPLDIPLGNVPICFQRALMSRLGTHGVPTAMMQELYAEVRCQVRRFCKMATTRNAEEKTINVALMVRSETRRWKDIAAWERVLDAECAKVEGCRRRSIYVANMTFCEQVQSMMETDIVVSVHGAQLTNMMFMSPGGRVLEMFPKGWLEQGGEGQYFYHSQASRNGLVHEGFWRDNDMPDCPTPEDRKKCWTYIKGQDVGINETYIATWFGSVLKDFQATRTPSASDVGDKAVCTCMGNESS